MGWRDRDYATLTDEERKKLWGTPGRRDRCAVCGRPVRGLPDAEKRGSKWFCSTGHALSYGGDWEKSGAKPLRKTRKVIKWTLIVFGALFVVLLILSFTSLGTGHKTAAKGSHKGVYAAKSGIGDTIRLGDVA